MRSRRLEAGGVTGRPAEAEFCELAGPEFDRSRADGRELTLDDAVAIALG